jgi:hypothetical protein
MVTLIFCIIAAIIIICIIFKKAYDCFDGFTLSIAILCGLIAGGVVGGFGNGMLSKKINGNLDYYLLESKNNYKLIQQMLDDKTYCVKEITKPNIYYTFEYATSYDTKSVKTYDNILIEYGRAEKPRVTVEHYEPNIWLRLFTFCQAEDYYYITLPDQNYLSMTLD